jgi:hypothetical protein
VFYCTLKLTHWTEPPWLVYILGHISEEVARSGIRRLLESSDPHFQVQRLHNEPLLSQCELFEIGDCFSDGELNDLWELRITYTFAWSAERRIEAQHRRTKQIGYGAPNHSEVYQSFGLRRGELTETVDRSAEAVKDLAMLAQEASTPQAACEALGLQYNPVLVNLPKSQNKYRNPAYAEVIYHADMDALYGQHDLRLAHHTTQVKDANGSPGDVVATVDEESVNRSKLLEHFEAIVDPLLVQYFSVSKTANCLRQLRTLLQAQCEELGRPHENLSDLGLEVDAFEIVGGGLETEVMFKDIIFLQVVCANVKGLKRARVNNEAALNASDLAVQVHGILKVERGENSHIVVNVVGAALMNGPSCPEPLVFSLSALSLEQLRHVLVWGVEDCFFFFSNSMSLQFNCLKPCVNSFTTS